MDTTLHTPSRQELFAGFFSVGLSGFGGVLPLAHRMLVMRRRWLSDAEFTEVLGLGQVLPGPNIVNVAVAVGSRFHGMSGALAAVGGLMLAPLVIVLLLATLYGQYQSLPALRGVLAGLASAGAGLVVAMGLRLAERLERRGWCLATALLTLVAVTLWNLPLLGVLLVIAPLAIALAWWTREGRP